MLEEALGYLDSLYSPIVGQSVADFITAAIIIVKFFVAAKLINAVIKRIPKMR